VTTMLSRPKKKAPMARRRLLTYIGCAVILLAGAGVGLTKLAEYIGNVRATCVNQGVTVILHDTAGQCVGVTDGLYQFDRDDKDLVGVEKEISAEDQWVRNTGLRYVSVAYLLPISAAVGVEPINVAIEQLAGAYARQHFYNHSGNSAPLIQLLIASNGTDAAGHQITVNEIETDVTSQHLVAVAGVGVSLNSTIYEVKQLTRDNIPVFGGNVTSDEFDNIPNMVRVAPSNQTDVHAMLDYIAQAHTATATLVWDSNQTDSYAATLVKGFRAGYHGRLADTESYDSIGDSGLSSAAAQQVKSSIGDMVTNICANAGSVVLFAGRGRDLATLVEDLSQHCDKPITIVTGDDASEMNITPALGKALSQGITLKYTGEANPTEWVGGNSAIDLNGRKAFSTFSTAFSRQLPYASDTDGNAMMGYDAMMTAIAAIDLAGVNPGPIDVDRKLGALHGSLAVPGASGPINLFAGSSNPVGKVVPIMQLKPDGAHFLIFEQP
jgi:Periplasmic binding protein